MRTLYRLSVTAFAVVAFLGIAGCDEEEDAARIVVDVVSLNGNSPLMSDVYNLNNTPTNYDDDFVPVDVVEVTFEARPHDGALSVSPFNPFGSVRFTRYDIQYLDGVNTDGADLDGNGTVDLANFSAPMNTVVDVYDSATGYILIVGGGVKLESPIVDLRMGGEFGTEARITFHGVEETSGKSIKITRGLTVRIADFGDTRR